MLYNPNAYNKNIHKYFINSTRDGDGYNISHHWFLLQNSIKLKDIEIQISSQFLCTCMHTF